MRTSALIFLLLALLAPRLNAALPHALACAGQGSTAASMMAETPPAHQHHKMASASDISAHDHHLMASHSSHDEHNADSHAKHTPQHDANSSDDQSCQHCGQCDEHCSAVALTALPQQQARPGAERLANSDAGQRVGFSHDLNRPPRTTSL